MPAREKITIPSEIISDFKHYPFIAIGAGMQELTYRSIGWTVSGNILVRDVRRAMTAFSLPASPVPNAAATLRYG